LFTIKENRHEKSDLVDYIFKQLCLRLHSGMLLDHWPEDRHVDHAEPIKTYNLFLHTYVNRSPSTYTLFRPITWRRAVTSRCWHFPV